MSATTTSRPSSAVNLRHPVAVGPGTLADVTAAARVLEPPAVPGTDAGECEALLRLALAHLAVGAGGLWLAREASSPSSAVSAAALLPPGSHPDVAAMAWMAHLQLELAPPGRRPGRRPGSGPGDGLAAAHVLLPPRRAVAAVDLVRAALTGAPGGDVVAPVPGHPVVAGLLRAQGFSPSRVPGLLRRAG